ncbi:ferritin-like domain-containing protein [Aliiroseovarius sp. S253]|uniref:ferritin-like domain-containing protein n=1 Tax=Aliiroseovarius sp. S253 TaxID=3415133 RepID=UPI003C7A7D37
MKKTGILSSAAVVICLAMPLQAATQTLSDEAEAALLEALNDEYHAQAFYAALVEEYGPNTPFKNIMEAEARHAEKVIKLLNKYDVEVPENGYLDGSLAVAPIPPTLDEAYEMGVQAEIDNIALYEENLLPAVADYNDITRVLTALKTASETKHLPTFERCSDGDCRNVSARSGSGAGKQAGRTTKGTSSQKGKGQRDRKRNGQGKQKGSGKS